MTLLGAVVLPSGEIVLTSDRLGTQIDQQGSARWGVVNKWLPIHGGTHLFWGWAGSDKAAFPMTEWIESKANIEEWADLCDEASAKMRFISASIAATTPGHQTDCVIAGWIKGVPGILRIQYNGDTNWHEGELPPTSAVFAGTSQFRADVAWQYVTRYLPDVLTDVNFGDLMRLVISEDPFLHGFASWTGTTDAGFNRTEARDPTSDW